MNMNIPRVELENALSYFRFEYGSDNNDVPEDYEELFELTARTAAKSENPGIDRDLYETLREWASSNPFHSPQTSPQAPASASASPKPRATPGGRKTAPEIAEEIAPKPRKPGGKKKPPNPRPDRPEPDIDRKVESTAIRQTRYELRDKVCRPFNLFLRQEEKAGRIGKDVVRTFRLPVKVDDEGTFQELISHCSTILDNFHADKTLSKLPLELDEFRRSCNSRLVLHVPLEFIDNYLRELSGAEAKVLLTVFRFLHVVKGGTHVWPSMKKIADKAGVGEDNVRKLLVKLEEKGFVRRDPKKKRDKETRKFSTENNIHPFWRPE